ncbi:MAG: response regulator [Hyphomonadaceae bacterium]
MSSARTVAILEDDAAAADALTLILADWGAHTIHGLTAEDVLSRVERAEQLDYLIADFNIGAHPNGVSAARKLKEAAPHLRVLILTGTFQRRGEVIAQAEGYDVMFKPARAEEIIAWLEQP